MHLQILGARLAGVFAYQYSADTRATYLNKLHPASFTNLLFDSIKTVAGRFFWMQTVTLTGLDAFQFSEVINKKISNAFFHHNGIWGGDVYEQLIIAHALDFHRDSLLQPRKLISYRVDWKHFRPWVGCSVNHSCTRINVHNCQTGCTGGGGWINLWITDSPEMLRDTSHTLLQFFHSRLLFHSVVFAAKMCV